MGIIAKWVIDCSKDNLIAVAQRHCFTVWSSLATVSILERHVLRSGDDGRVFLIVIKSG